MGHLSLLKMGSGFDYFEPAEILIRGSCFGDGMMNGILDAFGGGSDEFDLFVGMFTHEGIINLEVASVYGRKLTQSP